MGLGKLPEARHYLELAEGVARKREEMSSSAGIETLSVEAQLYQMIGSRDDALRVLREALNICGDLAELGATIAPEIQAQIDSLTKG